MAITLGEITFKAGGFKPFFNGAENQADLFQRLAEQLFSFFRLLPYPIMVLDGTGTAIMVNEAFLTMYKIDSEKGFCGTYNILKDPLGNAPGIRECLERIFQGETAFLPCAFGVAYPDSASGRRRSDIFSSSVCIPVFRPDDTIGYVISIRTDISEQKKIEEQLRSGEEMFRTMIHAIQETAFLIRADGDVLIANETVAGRLGETMESIVGKNIFDLVHPDEKILRRNVLAKLVQTGKPFRGEIQRGERFLMASANPVFNADKKVDRVAIFATDITGLKKAQEEIRKSEERMRALLEGSSDMVQVLDEQGVLQYVSPSMEKILGYDSKMPLGDSTFKIIHPDDLPGIQKQFAECLKNPEKPIKVQCRCLHINGTWRHIEAWAKNHLANPAIRGIVLNIRDITGHIEVQERLEASEEKFRSIVEQSRDGISIIDATGTVIIFNKAMELISGIPADEALGKKIWDVQYQCMTDAYKAIAPYKQFKSGYQKFLKTGKSPWLDSNIEVEMVRPDGRRIHLQTLLFPLRINGTVAYASFNRDVTAYKNAEVVLKQRESELEERAQLLQQKNAALRELMSQVESEKKRTAEQIHTNIDQLVLPLVHRLKTRCCEADRVYVEMIEESLGEIVAGSGIGISSAMHHLTQREIEMCTMIRQGITSKEIGRLLNISPRTVETHRNRIRKKLGIDNPVTNLVTFLKNSFSSQNGK
jgi:PAS domain S-box-containing protein